MGTSGTTHSCVPAHVRPQPGCRRAPPSRLPTAAEKPGRPHPSPLPSGLANLSPHNQGRPNRHLPTPLSPAPPCAPALQATTCERKVRIYDLQADTEAHIPEAEPLVSMTLSRDGRFLLVNLTSNCMHLWDCGPDPRELSMPVMPTATYRGPSVSARGGGCSRGRDASCGAAARAGGFRVLGWAEAAAGEASMAVQACQGCVRGEGVSSKASEPGMHV